MQPANNNVSLTRMSSRLTLEELSHVLSHGAGSNDNLFGLLSAHNKNKKSVDFAARQKRDADFLPVYQEILNSFNVSLKVMSSLEDLSHVLSLNTGYDNLFILLSTHDTEIKKRRFRGEIKKRCGFFVRFSPVFSPGGPANEPALAGFVGSIPFICCLRERKIHIVISRKAKKNQQMENFSS